MNTPEPCDTCLRLYVDALSEDNPEYQAECKKGRELGNKNCTDYIKWDETSNPIDGWKD
jgi:hypothetical protein